MKRNFFFSRMWTITEFRCGYLQVGCAGAGRRGGGGQRFAARHPATLGTRCQIRAPAGGHFGKCFFIFIHDHDACSLSPSPSLPLSLSLPLSFNSSLSPFFGRRKALSLKRKPVTSALDLLRAGIAISSLRYEASPSLFSFFSALHYIFFLPPPPKLSLFTVLSVFSLTRTTFPPLSPGLLSCRCCRRHRAVGW